ncbi:MAG TPA: TrkH family potassium uptake protein [Rhodobacteraceae bacterium]|nr:TrkH family potassium uptake protein [Paracoccaceae bacterium]
MRLIVFINGLILVFGAILMGVVALAFGNASGVFLLASVLALTLGAMLALASHCDFPDLRTLDTFLLTATVWLTAAGFGMLPLYMWNLSFTDAFFESMSAVTTTGSTIMSGLDTTPRDILLWRGILQWLGGVGFIVTGMALLPMLKVGGMQLFRTESSDQGEKELKSSTMFAAATFWAYLSLTVACMTVYSIGGMSFFDALVHSLTTLSSGGFSNYDASFGHFDSSFLQWSATFFMGCAGIPFAWYIRAVRKQDFRSEQVRVYLAVVAGVTLLMTFWLSAFRGFDVLDALRLVAFNVVSAVTTTGYATTDYTTWGGLAAVVFFLLTASGGCTGSTAGGAKMMRWIILVRSLKVQISRIRYPHGIFTLKYEGKTVSQNVLDGVMSFFVFYIFTVVIIAAVLSLIGLDFSTAISGALTSVANVGPGVGNIIGPAGNFADLPDSAKWVLFFGMYVGRLEMLTVFVLFTAGFWREAV